eukprot:TRINITY_DN6974_c0_g1_i1.p1 TRINITY_DN6974_c0_g1~~TRINITY_DN6974_c0_g1_i1.p1  ORF type:complete len:766 (-),score=131.36 TRINITY_DN6974_c0_g1_i1:63-2309(-)
MKVYLQILGTCGDSFPSFLLFYDTRRYLFNVGEGTQRLCLEHKIRLSKIDYIFLTGLEWRHVGGLPGMLLTMADAGSTGVGICGPKGTGKFLSSLNSFVYRDQFQIHLYEFDGEYSEPIPFYPELAVLPVVTQSTVEMRNESEQEDKMKMEMDKENLEWKTLRQSVLQLDEEQRQHETEPKTKRAKVEPMETVIEPLNGHPSRRFAMTPDNLRALPSDRGVSGGRVGYVCVCPDLPGKFDPAKALALGLKKGPDFGKLTKGQPVTTPQGITILPQQCIGPNQPGAVFVLLDCPTVHHFQHLCVNPVMLSYAKNNSVALVVHITPESVVCSPAYTQWIDSWPKDTKHIVVNPDRCDRLPVFRSAALQQSKLNRLDGQVFPLPFGMEMKPFTMATNERMLAGRSLMMINLAASRTMGIGIDDSACVSNIDHTQVTQQLQAKQLVDCIDKTRSLVESVSPAIPSSMAGGSRLVFLGTGSALPGKYRNVTGMYLEYDHHAMMIDAGEGSYGQLYRIFGVRIDEIIKKLKIIYISHMHADHHLGAVNLILTHQRLTGGVPLVIIGPRGMRRWLDQYATVEHFEYIFVYNGFLNSPQHALSEVMEKQFGLQEFWTVPVLHCHDAFGLILKFGGFKLVYSGDTRPCDDLIQAGRDANLLIHEATFEDSMAQEAIEKSHSTTAEAIEVGVKMGAQQILLTHFSQRYPKIPFFDSKFENKISIAFDMMVVDLNRMQVLPLFISALREMFKEEEEESE